MKNTLTRTKNTVSAPYLPYAAYQSALALATAHKGVIGKTDKGNFKATFSSAKVAEKFVAEWTAEYEANRKVEVASAPKSAPAQKPKASKGKTAPRKAKAKGFDFATIKGETNKDKNRALHAMLVSIGMKDSRSAEYQAIWNARPWAK